jgi:ABC-2 type transport system ATP-binding protein
VILDEPISGLDPVQIVEMRSVIRSLAAGRAVIISSHILGEISQTCDRLVVLNQGEVAAQGTEAELLSQSRSDIRLEIQVRGDAEAFATFLGSHKSVIKVDRVDAPAGMAAAKVQLSEDVREMLVADLVGEGFGIRTVDAPIDELEGVFLALTAEAA